LKDELAKERPTIAMQTISEQYDPSKHEITKRLDKPIETDAGPSTAKVLKLEVPLHKKIVGQSVAFLCGNAITLDAGTGDDVTKKDLLSVIVKTRDDSKTYYRKMNIAVISFSETEWLSCGTLNQ
jgi:hypothetical protein